MLKCCKRKDYDFGNGVKDSTMELDTMGDDESGDENKERGNWSGKMDFLLSAIGYAVGLGNVWRFPYKAYTNGGASFLIPYLIMLLTAGLPLFFLEMGFGQFASLGPISVWRAVPFFKGIGWAMVVISGLVCIYYNMIIAYTLYYIFASFTSKVPWQDCQPEWVEKYGCHAREFKNASARNATDMWCKSMMEMNMTDSTDYRGNCTQTVTPSQVYWERVVLDVSDGIDEGGSEIRWQLALCLLLAWIIIFLCLIKGIKSSGKVVYFTATFPYIVLIILLIRNATLEGAYLGIQFYIIPDWSKLADAKVWYAAASQIFYSLGVGFGGLETMASYNRFNNNVYRDSIIVSVLNCATSVFAGFVIFSVLGHMSFITGIPVANVATDGPGLAFIAYPEGIAMMPVAPLWSILFFLMLFTLGLDSQFAMMETVISSLVDEFAWFRQGRRKIVLTAGICVLLFILGLPQCSRAGIYVMTLFDWYSAGFSLMIVAFLEVTAINWIYGYQRFAEDIKMMIGFKPNVYWTATWLVITPAMLVFIIVFSAVQYSPVVYQDYVYPKWAENCGWLLVMMSLICIPVVGIIQYLMAHDFIATVKKVFSATQEWGPALPRHRTGRYADYMPTTETTPPPTYTPPGYTSPSTFKPESATEAAAADGTKGQLNEGFDASTYM